MSDECWQEDQKRYLTQNLSPRRSISTAALDSEIRLTYAKSKTCCNIFGETFKRVSSRRLDETIRPLVCYDTAMVMMIETFYELLTCTAVSVGMYQIKGYWNTSDKISVYYSIFTFITLVLFLLIKQKLHKVR